MTKGYTVYIIHKVRENLKYDLYDVLTSEGKTVSETFDLAKEHLLVAGEEYDPQDTEPVTLTLQNIALNKIYLTGKTAMTITFPCDRCLEPVPERMELSFERELLSEDLRERAKDGEAEECGYLDGNVLDVKALVEEEILLSMPAKILCRNDCKGLCPKCGANLNETECGCDTFVPDPRLAGLGDILEKMKQKEV